MPPAHGSHRGGRPGRSTSPGARSRGGPRACSRGPTRSCSPSIAAALARYEAFSAAFARRRIAAAGLTAICRCEPGYPDRLRELPDPPAVLHIAGSPDALPQGEAVAIVGSRRATPYGLEVSTSLGRSLTGAGVPVVSGMALGIDSAAHLGALEAIPGAPPVAVLAGGAETAYPARMRHLHARLIAHGAVVSEMPPGFGGHRWCFPARNRIIAALSTLTIVVEAATRSGSLITADLATDLGRTVAAVPGPVTSRASAGTNELLHAGAAVIRDARDALDLLFGADAPRLPDARPLPPLEPAQLRLLEQVERGHGTVAELARTMEEAQAGIPHALRARAARPRPPRSSGAVRPLPPTLRAMSSRVPAVLSIAGSDSGGGAGIQADLKAFARCGVHGMTAVTALTAQNTTGVSAIQSVPPEFIIEQVRQVATDIGVDAVKIGMLGTAETVTAVNTALDLLDPSVPIVIDPVMVAESGATLLDDGARAALRELLIPRATVITPNLPEARRARRQEHRRRRGPRPAAPPPRPARGRRHRRPPRRGHRRLLRRHHARDAERPAPPRRRRPRIRLHALERARRPPRPRRRPADRRTSRP